MMGGHHAGLETVHKNNTATTGAAVVTETASGASVTATESAVNNMIALKETLMRIIHSKSLFYWFILKVFDIQMVNSLFVYETVG